MKTGLLHVAEDRGGEARLEAAIQLARTFGTHLTCAQAAPLAAWAMADPFGPAYAPAELWAEHEKRQDKRRAGIEARLREEGIGFEWARRHGSLSAVLLDRSRLTDVIILSHLEGDDGGWDEELDLVGEIAVHARAPVLSVPYEGAPLNLQGTALVAWNGSFEAAQALRFALPVLGRAARIQILTIGEEPAEFPASAASAYLARHGIQSELLAIEDGEGSVPEQVLDAIIDSRCDLAVMGAYGHSRIRERLLGGVTREMLLQCPKPLLLAH